jgi:hypothetical protein
LLRSLHELLLPSACALARLFFEPRATNVDRRIDLEIYLRKERRRK